MVVYITSYILTLLSYGLLLSKSSLRCLVFVVFVLLYHSMEPLHNVLWMISQNSLVFYIVLYSSLVSSILLWVLVVLYYTIKHMVGVSSGVSFIDRIADMFIEDIDHESVFFYVAAALLSLNSIFSYPIIAYPPVLCLENMLHDGIVKVYRLIYRN